MDDQKPDADVGLNEAEHAAFRRLLDMLHTEYQFDFREYKTVSLLRRVRARMSQVRVEGFDTYIDYLRLHANEAAALFNTLLLNVTGFFRDPEAWEVLRREALPPLLTAAVTAGRLRVWSAGCSTGEETYSAAILIADALGARGAELDVKIYATDIDDDALSAARRAVFRLDQLKDVPADILERYFSSDGHAYRVRRELRRWCIFGRHNLTQDPPLPQINLLICRNVLIYFKSALQERLLTRFQYALREGGPVSGARGVDDGALARLRADQPEVAPLPADGGRLADARIPDAPGGRGRTGRAAEVHGGGRTGSAAAHRERHRALAPVPRDGDRARRLRARVERGGQRALRDPRRACDRTAVS
jgi:chemotaxis methyl-accepting protein methylase